MRLSARVALGTACALVWSAVSAQGEEVDRDDWVAFSLDAFGEWSDNRDSVSGDRPGPEVAVDDRFDYEKTDVVKLGIGPGIQLFRGFRGSHVRAEYGPAFQWWDDPRVGQTKTELTHQAYGEVFYNTGVRADSYLRDSFKYMDDPDLYMGSEELTVSPGDAHLTEENSHIDNRLSAGGRYRLAKRTYADMDANWHVTRYDDPLLADDGDEDGYDLKLGISRQHTAFLGFGVSANYSAYDRENIDDLPLGVESASIGVGARYKASKQVDISANYGYQFAWHENDEIDDRDYPTETRIEVAVIPTIRSRLVAGVEMSVVEAYVYPYVSQDRTAVYSSLTYQHTPQLTSTYRVDYRLCSYEERYTNPETPDDAFAGAAATRPDGSRDGDRNEIFVRLGLNYRWTDKLTLTCYYSHEDIDSDVNESYAKNTLGVRGRYEF